MRFEKENVHCSNFEYKKTPKTHRYSLDFSAICSKNLCESRKLGGFSLKSSGHFELKSSDENEMGSFFSMKTKRLPVFQDLFEQNGLII